SGRPPEPIHRLRLHTFTFTRRPDEVAEGLPGVPAGRRLRWVRRDLCTLGGRRGRGGGVLGAHASQVLRRPPERPRAVTPRAGRDPPALRRGAGREGPPEATRRRRAAGAAAGAVASPARRAAELAARPARGGAAQEPDGRGDRLCP